MLRNSNNVYILEHDDNIGLAKDFFTEEVLRLISRKITELTLGVDPLNRPIVASRENILGIMNSLYDNYTPPVGDIYSRYIVPSGDFTNELQNLIDKTIEVITNDIRVNLGMQENNSKLTIWTTVLGDFNEHGLRPHPPIKMLNRHPARCQFNMNY